VSTRASESPDILSETYLVDEIGLCCLRVARRRWRVDGVGKPARSVPGTSSSRKVSRRGGFGEDGGDNGAEERESLGCCKNSGRSGGAAVRPKVDTMVWSKSFGVSDMRDEQGVPCNLPEALLRNPNCWPLGTRTSTGGCPGTGYQVPVGDQANTWSSQRVLRCWPATAVGAVVVVVVAAGAGGDRISQISNLKSQIPNPKSQPSQAIRRSCVLLAAVAAAVGLCDSAARRGGPQPVQAGNNNGGVDWLHVLVFCLVFSAAVLETRRAGHLLLRRHRQGMYKCSAVWREMLLGPRQVSHT
jgi:hypothetical protein